MPDMSDAVTDQGMRADIITAAANVFERYGYTRVTMQDIARECKKGRSTLYHYFGNKQDMFFAFMESTLTSVVAECRKAIDSNKTFAQNIEGFHKTKLKKLKELSGRFSLVLADAKLDPKISDLKSEILPHNEMQIHLQIIEFAISNEEIKPLSHEHMEFLAETLYLAFKSFEHGILLQDRLKLFEEKLTWLASILQKGLS